MIMVCGRIHPYPTIVGWGVLLLLDKAYGIFFRVLTFNTQFSSIFTTFT